MTSALAFIHTLLADHSTKWETIAQALDLFDSTHLLPLPKNTTALSTEQNTLITYLGASFFEHWRFSEEHQSQTSEISTRNENNNYDFLQKPCVDFLVEKIGADVLCAPRKEFGNHSFLSCFCQKNMNPYNFNFDSIFLWMEALGTSAFEDIRVQDHSDEYQSVMGFIFERLASGGGTRTLPEQRRWEKILLSNNTNIANITCGGTPAVAYICTPKLWDAYIRDGGNPNTIVTYNYKEKPLWEALVTKSDDIKDTALNMHLKKWGTAHNKNVEQIITSAYFTRLTNRVGSYQPRYQDLKDVVTSSPNWFTLVDNEQRTPMMLTVAKHKSAYKIFSAKKYRADLEKRDNKGRNVLAYAIKDSTKISPEALQFLFSVPELITLPEDGRGIIQHLNDFNTGLRGLANYARPEDDTVRLEQMRAWIGAPEQQKSTAAIIANRYFQDHAYQGGVSRLVRFGATKVVKRKDLIGAMALCVAGNLAQLIRSYQRSYTWKSTDQLDAKTDSKQIRANLMLTSQIERLEKMLTKAIAPEFQSEEVQKRWNDALPAELFQSVGCDYSFTVLCDRMSKNVLTQALGTFDPLSQSRKSRKI